MRIEDQLPKAMEYYKTSKAQMEPHGLYAGVDVGLGCRVGFHLGINNSTGKCIACGAQLERASESGFAKAAYLGDII